MKCFLKVLYMYLRYLLFYRPAGTQSRVQHHHSSAVFLLHFQPTRPPRDLSLLALTNRNFALFRRVF